MGLPTRVGLGAIVVVAVSCGGNEVFACLDDDACAEGICQPEGYCSFPDDACPSGQRFGEFAGDGLAGTCVGERGTSTSGEVTTTTATATTQPSLTTGVADSSTGAAVDESGTTGSDCPDWWDCAWAVRVPITVVWTGATLDDFPVRVLLDARRFDLSQAAPDGADVRFVDAAGTLLPHEIEVFSPEDGVAEIWVRVPTLEDGTRLFLYAGQPAAADTQDPAAVWSNGFLAVWHLGPDAIDSVTGTLLEDDGTLDADGQIGRARSFDGTAAFMRPDPSLPLLNLFERRATLSAWIRPMGWGQGGYGRILDISSVNTSMNGWSLSVASSSPDGPTENLRFGFGYTSTYAAWRSAQDVTLDQWQHVALAYQGGDPMLPPEIYIDGLGGPPGTETNGVGMPNQITTAPAAIGAIGSADIRFFDGVIDEVRISTVGRTPDWIAAEHADGLDALLAYEPLQTAPQ